MNYHLDKGYAIADKDIVICGSEETLLTEIYADNISEGSFPKAEDEIIASGNVKKELELDIGSELVISVLMIAGSLNTSIAGRTESFGMLRCIGASPKQIVRIVHREVFGLCTTAIPASILTGMAVIWILCAILRILCPAYFAAMPVFAVSPSSIAAEILTGILTVLTASRAPAKRASRVSPLMAATGNANTDRTMKRAYGRMFAYDIPAVSNGQENMAMLTSYEEQQFKWAEKYLLNGSPEKVQDQALIIRIYCFRMDSCF